ncbi:MAG: hypothetical protein K8S00_06070 [Bacteroidales bacterium]|nr:hypothetical protein [Bacteroidales bacterium]
MFNADFSLFPFNIEKIKEKIRTIYKYPLFTFENNDHFKYLTDYLKVKRVQTVVFENEYVDKDYLEDYAEYYSRSFTGYKKKCHRLHFFSFEFTDDELKIAVGNYNPEFIATLKEKYLGFCVIKPIPETYFGKTCLKTYDEKDGRYFPIKREYTANLLGIELKVESLAYQEQDENVAACATSALWSAFHYTGMKFQHEILSPVKITKSATRFHLNANRQFPNEGLSSEEMANGIRSFNLDPLFINHLNHFKTKETIYSYLKGKIPVLLGIVLCVENDEGNFKYMGRHAITVTGFNIDKNQHLDGSAFSLEAHRISKNFAHDDQIGPYSRIEFVNEEITYLNDKNGTEQKESVKSSWKNKDYPGKQVRAIPEILLVPLYHKIRIPFNVISEITQIFYSAVKTIAKVFSKDIGEFIWDIFLIEVNDLKAKILQNTTLSKSQKERILCNSLPKYIWIARAYQENELIFDLLFDATDIKQGKMFIMPIEYNSNFSRLIRFFSKNLDLDKIEGVKHHIFKWFNDMKTSPNNYEPQSNRQ